MVHDIIAHFFWNAEHMVTVHHQHGDQHTEEEIARATHDEGHEKAPATSKISDPVSIHILLQDHCIVPCLSAGKSTYGIRVYQETSFVLAKRYPPPRWC
jgi:hypothetical protein